VIRQLQPKRSTLQGSRKGGEREAREKTNTASTTRLTSSIQVEVFLLFMIRTMAASRRWLRS
jgi:hypothetical protein